MITKTIKNSLMLVCLISILIFTAGMGSASDTKYQIIAVPEDGETVYLPFVTREGYPITPTADFRTVYATYFNTSVVSRAMGIFWFGKVTPTENSADVRVGYNATDLVVDIRIIDQQIWYDRNPTSLTSLTEWDAVSLFIDTSTNPGESLTENNYQIVAQYNNSQIQDEYQVIYQGGQSNWNEINLPITIETQGFWQPSGGPNENSEEDYGWMARFTIPFTSLDFAAPPHNALWRFGVMLHDRDDVAGTPIGVKTWPETLNSQKPNSWGGLHFGQMSYTPPSVNPDGISTIRNGVNGAVVLDAHVGGAFNCGEGLDHWTEWGNKNYESDDPTRINIQNQTLIGDWPCFSKYFVTFPMDAVPVGRTIISATLTMYHYGNSGGGDFDPPQHSWIQVFTVSEDWIDTNITWNNAPLAFENIGMTRVEPVNIYPGWPGIPINWDISRAVIAAYQAGEPLRLALYSADSEMHSGKYFFSSDSNSDGSARPVVTIYWAIP